MYWPAGLSDEGAGAVWWTSWWSGTGCWPYTSTRQQGEGQATGETSGLGARSTGELRSQAGLATHHRWQWLLLLL